MQGHLKFSAAEAVLPPEGVPLLTVRYRLPRWSGTGGRRFNRYYDAYARAFLSYCRMELLPQARAALALAQESGGPIPAWQAALDTTVTLETDTLLSLYTDATERCGAEALTLRRSDTWEMRTGLPLPPESLFPAGSHWRRTVTARAAEQIEAELARGVSLYHPDWRRRLRAALGTDHFYLTPDALCLYCQMYAVAPAVEGIPVFSIPYDPVAGPFPPA